MKNKVFIKAGIIVCMIIVGLQHIYGQNNEVRTLDNFNKLTVSGNAKVYLTPGSPQQVRVETKNELKEVKTTVTDGKLKIDGKPSSVYIIIPSVEEINVSGFGEIRIDSTISGNNLILNISGKGKILAPITYSALEGNISGFGKMKLNGTVQKMNLNISGNGTIDAAELKTENANIQISGIAKATVDVKERLDLAITGVGTVYYKTEPKVITKNISGVGKYGVIDTDEPDTTTVHVGKKRIIIIGNEEKKPDVKDEDKEETKRSKKR